LSLHLSNFELWLVLTLSKPALWHMFNRID